MSDAEVQALWNDRGLVALFATIQNVTLAGVVCFAVVVFLKTKGYGRTILAGWAGMVVWALANTLIIPLLFEKGGLRGASFLCPEPPLVVAMIFMGWMHGVVFAGVIFLVRLGIRGFQMLRERMRVSIPKT